MTIAIDFDGTIVDHKYPEIGNLKPNAKEVINALVEDGHTIIIWTCRAGVKEQEAANFLLKNGIRFHYINENSKEVLSQFDGDCRKVFGDVYIDDRNIGTKHIDWLEIYKLLNARKH